MYEEFLKQIEDFMFIEDKPEKADVIFVPGNGYPQMAEKQRSFTGMGLHKDPAQWKIQYHSREIYRSS